MGFKSTPASIGTSNTDVFLMGTGLAGAIVLGIGNQTSGAIAYTVKIFKQATGLTTTIVTSQSLAGNQFKKFEIPLALEAGDKVIMTAASTGIVAFATVTDSASAPVATGWNPRGSYSSIATYAINDVVTAPDGSSYISLDNDNTGNDPTSSPMHWMVNAEKGETGEAGDTAMSIVRVAATTNKLTASELENGDTVDGVTLATGDLVLLVGQTSAAENGVYSVVASGAASRAAAFNTYDSHPGRYFSVMEGTVGADKLYRCTSNKGGTLGTTALVIEEFTSGGGGVVETKARVSLASGVAVTESDITGASAIYVIPVGHNSTMIYDGSKDVIQTYSQITVTLDSTNAVASKNYDIFLAFSGGNVVAGYGPDWTAGASAGSNTARGTGAGSTEIELFNGRLVNKNAITLRNSSGTTYSIGARQANLVGGFRTTANGLTEDSFLNRFVWSVLGAPRIGKVIDSTDTWNYSVATYRQMRGVSTNAFSYLHGLGGRPIVAKFLALAVNSTVTFRGAYSGIGVDSTSINSATTASPQQVSNDVYRNIVSDYAGYPGIGYHQIVPLEKGNGNDTQTWGGDVGQPNNDFQSGMTVQTEM